MNSASSLPEWVERVLETAPVYSDKRAMAELFSSLFGPIVIARSKIDLLLGRSPTVMR